MKHVHAESMAEYAKDALITDKPWELWQSKHPDGDWGDLLNHPSWFPNLKYRQKAKQISINGIEVPAPLRKANYGDKFYVVSPTNEGGCFESIYTDHTIDDFRLANGLCHSSKDAAIIHCKALLSFTQQ